MPEQRVYEYVQVRVMTVVGFLLVSWEYQMGFRLCQNELHVSACCDTA